MERSTLWLPVFGLWGRNILDHFYKVSVFLDTIWYQLLNLVLVVLFLIRFSNQKPYFLIACLCCVGFTILLVIDSDVWYLVFSV